MQDALRESTVDQVMLDNVMAMSPTPRVQRLREFSLNLQSTFSIDRARIETRVLKETEGEPMITRRAKVFAAVAREMPIHIQPDELFVGGDSVRPGCVNISPVSIPVMQRVRVGAHGEAERTITDSLSDDERKELNEELTPYWREQGKIVAGWQHYGHNVHNYEKVLSKGLLGIRKDAEEKLAELDKSDPENRDKILFLRGVVMAMEAASEIGARFAAKARELAGWSVAAGDVNGDGFDDVIIGARNADPSGGPHAGEVYVVFGGASLPGTTVDLNSVSGDVRVLGDNASDNLGYSSEGGATSTGTGSRNSRPQRLREAILRSAVTTTVAMP